MRSQVEVNLVASGLYVGLEVPFKIKWTVILDCSSGNSYTYTHTANIHHSRAVATFMICIGEVLRRVHCLLIEWAQICFVSFSFIPKS